MYRVIKSAIFRTQETMDTVIRVFGIQVAPFTGWVTPKGVPAKPEDLKLSCRPNFALESAPWMIIDEEAWDYLPEHMEYLVSGGYTYSENPT